MEDHNKNILNNCVTLGVAEHSSSLPRVFGKVVVTQSESMTEVT